jgi:chromosome segregation ATPase
MQELAWTAGSLSSAQGQLSEVAAERSLLKENLAAATAEAAGCQAREVALLETQRACRAAGEDCQRRVAVLHAELEEVTAERAAERAARRRAEEATAVVDAARRDAEVARAVAEAELRIVREDTQAEVARCDRSGGHV